MSTNPDESDLTSFARDPIKWLVGAVVAFFSVVTAIALDPTGSVATIALSLIDQAGLIFTAASITGFTLAPEISWIPKREIQAIAIIFGIIVVAGVIDKVWDNLKERLDDK